MRVFSAIIAVLAAAMIVASTPAGACEAAGPSTHVGQVLKVDRANGSFSIMDAEKLTAITFSAGKDILDKVADTKKMAVVNYEDTGNGLQAVSVSLQ